MLKDLEIWQFAAERLKRDEAVMLLVVAESAGSSPGRQGFKMIVAEDELAGSIGGGVMEVRLVKRAKFKIQNSKFKIDSENSAIIEQIHRKNSPLASGMICSGRQTVIFFKLTPAEHLKPIRKIIQCLKNNRERYLRITENELTLTAKKIPPFDFKFERQNAGRFVYEEKLGLKNKLIIVGGGHCALALSELMSKLDFYIALFDDRADLNTLAKNRFVHEKNIIESYEKIGEFVTGGADVYLVVMTLGFAFDEIVIRQLIEKDFKYFGVLGSRAKMKILLGNLAKEGFAKENLDRIRTPVGLQINSRTPEEIAVSIAAEIIAVKNAK
jgi:xanthine dehydrogenase accessory factor